MTSAKNYKIDKIQTLIKSFNNNNYFQAKSIALDLINDFEDDYLVNKILGFLYFKENNYRLAILNFETSLKSNKEDIEILFNLGVCYQYLSNFIKSSFYYKKLLFIKPNHKDGILNFSILIKDHGYFKKSEELLLSLIKIDSDHFKAHLNLSILYIHVGKILKAINHLNICLKINPNDHHIYNNLGIANKALGKFKLAKKNFERAIIIKKDFAKAYYNLSLIKNYKPNDPHLNLLKNLSSQNINSTVDKFHYLFALAKIFQDIRDFKSSFKAYAEANAACKNLYRYDHKTEMNKFIQIKRNFNLIKEINLKNISNKLKPIFIIGMPRSGSTLIEQILSSHSSITAGGELNFISNFYSNISNFNKIDSNILNEFKENYLSELKILSDNKLFITDKNPLNFKFIAIISKLFPDSKIIHTTRSPTSVCWSIFTKFFPNRALGFSNNLNDIVSYFELYSDLMIFWKINFPNNIYEIKYENLINDQLKETKNLLKFLDIPWEENCLFPEKNNRIIMTASNQQVRDPIHKNNLNLWNNFLPYIDANSKFFELINE